MIAPRLHGHCSAALLCLAVLCLPSAVASLELTFPGTADLVRTTGAVEGQHPIATGPWAATGQPTRGAEGVVQEFTWQIRGDAITTLSLATTLREQMETQGYGIDFECFANACGGFDFRHALPVGQSPEMHVDLGDFRYLSGTSESGEDHAAIMISRGGATGFVHLALIQPATSVAAPVVQSTRTPEAEQLDIVPGDLIDRLTSMGSAPLDDLRFQTGASSLSGEGSASLLALADFLAADPTQSVVLVGHTDASGSLAGNISLSQARASAVRSYLINTLSVNPAQVEAQGIGFLAPRAPNSTAEGREANRRVEVVLATTN